MADLMEQRRKRLSNTKVGGAGYNQFAAGKRSYGTGRPFPNMGKTKDMSGYQQRDQRAKARRDAVLKRMQKERK